jgi:CHASE2 domain-containing sensor protein
VIRPVLKWDQAIVEFLLYLWPVTVLFSAAYLAFRGPRRDIVFHCVLGVAIGLTCGAAFCLGILLLFGGWCPPWPEWFGLAGLGFGLFLALLDWSVGKVG